MAPKPIAAHAYITYMGGLSPSPLGGFTYAGFSANLSNKVRKLGLAIHWYNTNRNKLIYLITSLGRSQGFSQFFWKGESPGNEVVHLSVCG